MISVRRFFTIQDYLPTFKSACNAPVDECIAIFTVNSNLRRCLSQTHKCGNHCSNHPINPSHRIRLVGWSIGHSDHILLYRSPRDSRILFRCRIGNTADNSTEITLIPEETFTSILPQRGLLYVAYIQYIVKINVVLSRYTRKGLN